VLQPVERVVPEWQVYTGRLEAVDRVEVRARVTGFVQRVHFDEGARVARGDLLYSLDPRTFVAERDAARARVDEAQARLALARSEAERVQGLISSRAVSREELDQRTRQVDTATASLAAARAALESSALDLEFTRVVAPVAGRVGRALVTEVTLVSGGSGDATVLTTIVSLDPIYLRFPIDEPTALRLRRVVDGSDEAVPVDLQLTGGTAFEHRGRLDFLDNRIDEETGTLMVRAVFDNPDGALVPGAFGRVRVQLDPPETRLLVPEKALGVDQTQEIVMVVGDGDVVERRVVTTGPLADGWRVIRSGIESGDRVVVEGLLSARPGSTVSPKPLEPPQ
jgi:RND family efflux transporter MFP subunit